MILLATSVLAAAEDRAPVEPNALPAPDQEMEPVKPAIEKTGENTYRMGDVEFDRKTREIRFPAKVNMNTGLLEFLIVHQNGKVHESLLVTESSATNINLAFSLLRYKLSRELYFKPSKTGGLSDQLYVETDEVKAASRFRIDLEWKQDGVLRRIPANDWVLHDVKAEAMPQNPWVFGGSYFHNGRFVPDETGSFVAIFVTNDAFANYLGEDNLDDTIWSAHTSRMPEVGTKVTVVFAPYIVSPPSPKP
jgi:hypothetical protein